MKKHADHLTPSHFGEANNSKINRKQRHRKQCETRDTRGIYHSNRANNTDIQPCGLFTLVFICKGLRVILYISSFLKCRKKIIPERSAPALILSVEKLLKKNNTHCSVYSMSSVPRKIEVPCVINSQPLHFPTKGLKKYLRELTDHVSPAATNLWFACHSDSLISPCLYLCLYN